MVVFEAKHHPQRWSQIPLKNAACSTVTGTEVYISGVTGWTTALPGLDASCAYHRAIIGDTPHGTCQWQGPGEHEEDSPRMESHELRVSIEFRSKTTSCLRCRFAEQVRICLNGTISTWHTRVLQFHVENPRDNPQDQKSWTTNRESNRPKPQSTNKSDWTPIPSSGPYACHAIAQ